jgi:hypothetical protein
MARMRSTRVTISAVLGAPLTLTLASCSAADGQPSAFSDSGVMQSTGGSSFGGAGSGGVRYGAGGNQTGTGGRLVAGASSMGGSPSGGASGANGNGGLVGTGGASPGGSNPGTGGAASCTDAPPPNGDTCEHAVLYGWCGADWMHGACARSCGACSGGAGGGSSGGANGTGGTPNTGGAVNTGGIVNTGGNVGAGGLPPIQGGQNGWASRYWDCCKPACGWPGNVQGGNAMRSCDSDNRPLSDNNAQNVCVQGGPAYMCWSGAPWSVNQNLSYGFAATTGGNYVCGRCYQLQFTGSGHNSNNPGAASLNGKSMIVQVINNGGLGGDQFDLLIPGGGVGDFDGCTKQWGPTDLGERYGGFLAVCNGDKSCVQRMCTAAFSNKPELLAGCSWFLGWFNAADNPNLVFKQIACPLAITQRSGLPDPG